MNEQDDRQYIDEKINPILQKLMLDVLISKPEEPVDFCIAWLQDKGDAFRTNGSGKMTLDQLKKEQNKRKNDDSEEEDDEDYDEAEFIKNTQAKKGQAARTSVSAEVYGAFNKKESVELRVIQKTDEQKRKIAAKIEKSFIFSNLNKDETKIVIDAMKIIEVKKNEHVITQGKDGDCLYVVEIGDLDCYKRFPNTTEDKHLKVYKPGESFGELALLYNCPRAATIISKTDCTLFELDRQTFNVIVKDAAQKKRDKYEAFLSGVDILKSMDDYERSKIADAIKEIHATSGQQVITQGQNGDDFFLILEGSLIALKDNKQVFEYEKGQYFGELALINDVPRAATVLCTTDCTLLTLDKFSFNRLLGPLTDILERNKDMYAKYMQQH